MARWVKWTVLTASIIAVTGVTGSAKNDVEIRLAGRYYTAPANLQITVAVEPHRDNRTLRVEADSGDMYVSTDVTLDGEKEARLHQIQFKNLSAGEYTLRAQVLAGDTVRAEATQEVMVTGMPDEPGW